MRPVGFVYCVPFLFGREAKHLHMTEQNQLAGLTTKEENHGSRQGTPESVPQSSSEAKEELDIFSCFTFHYNTLYFTNRYTTFLSLALGMLDELKNV